MHYPRYFSSSLTRRLTCPLQFQNFHNIATKLDECGHQSFLDPPRPDLDTQPFANDRTGQRGRPDAIPSELFERRNKTLQEAPCREDRFSSSYNGFRWKIVCFRLEPTLYWLSPGILLDSSNSNLLEKSNVLHEYAGRFAALPHCRMQFMIFKEAIKFK